MIGIGSGVAAFIIAGILDISVTGVAAFIITGDILLSSRRLPFRYMIHIHIVNLSLVVFVFCSTYVAFYKV